MRGDNSIPALQQVFPIPPHSLMLCPHLRPNAAGFLSSPAPSLRDIFTLPAPHSALYRHTRAYRRLSSNLVNSVCRLQRYNEYRYSGVIASSFPITATANPLPGLNHDCRPIYCGLPRENSHVTLCYAMEPNFLLDKRFSTLAI